MFSDLMDSLRRPTLDKKEWMKGVELILGTRQNLKTAIDECISSEVYGLDTETTGLDGRVFNGRTRDSLVGISIAPSMKKAYYFPLAHKEGSEHNIPWSLLGGEFSRLFDPAVSARPVLHNASFDQEFLEFNGFHSLGGERWDNPKGWEDSFIIRYLLNPRDKSGRGLKELSKKLLGMEMFELDELMPDSPVKDYSQLDPSWEPSVLYAAADALCTLGVYHELMKEYTPQNGHGGSIYSLEKMCVAATRWMHRNRVYINREKALEFCREGQAEWWQSVLDVYEGASPLLGRDITPNYIKILKGEIKSLNKFNPNEIGTEGGLDYKARVDEARKEATRLYPDPIHLTDKSVPLLGGRPGTETIGLPQTYDILSPQQLGLLFRELGVENLSATEKSGQVDTSGEVLDELIESLEEKMPFMGKVKRQRELTKALGQYLVPMIEDVAEDGTLMPKFKQFTADTGRFSCTTTSDPKKTRDGGCRVPFQGVPSSYDSSKPRCINEMRSCISARAEGWWIVAIDYSGVELRLVSNLSKEPKWIKAFYQCSECGYEYEQGEDEEGFPRQTPSLCVNCGADAIGDLHSVTAVAFYGEGAKKDPRWKALRGHGKQCNFALSYGGTAKAVQRSIEGCTPEEAEQRYKQFTSTYKTLTSWWSSQHQLGKAQGFVKTGFGRVQPLPHINEKEFRLASKDERKAVNGPVQGTSADITKLAMSLIYKTVKEKGWSDLFKMILTVHDEIVFEIHESIIGEAIPIVCDIMVRNKGIKAQKWPIPLLVDVEIGPDWSVDYNLKDLRQGWRYIKVPDGVDENGKPKVKKVKDTSLPQVLLDAFYKPQDKTEVISEPKPKPPSISTYTIEGKLTEASAQALAKWIVSQGVNQYKIMYNNRDITAIF